MTKLNVVPAPPSPEDLDVNILEGSEVPEDTMNNSHENGPVEHEVARTSDAYPVAGPSEQHPVAGPSKQKPVVRTRFQKRIAEDQVGIKIKICKVNKVKL